MRVKTVSPSDALERAERPARAYQQLVEQERTTPGPQ